MAECHCPHCQTAYPFVDKLIGAPVRCRQCRKPFVVDPDGSTRPLVTNRPLDQGEAEQGPADAILDLPKATAEESSQKPVRPSTKRIGKSPMLRQKRRKTSLALRQLAPNGLGALPGSPAKQVPEPAPGDDEEAVLAPPLQRPKRRLSSRAKNNTELIMSALRQSALGKTGPSPEIVQAVHEAKEEDTGNESTARVSAAANPAPEANDPPHIALQTGLSVSCPHCQTQYPFKQTLCDQLIRCRSCTGVFRVFPDGSSEPAIHNRALPPLPGQSAAQSQGVPPPAKAQRSKTQVLRNRDLVKAMSGNMAKVAEAVKAAKPVATAEAAASVQTVADRVIVNDGLAQRRSLRNWLVAGLLFLVVAGGLAYVGFSKSAEQLVLQEFQSAGYGKAAHQERIAKLRAKAWDSGAVVQPIIAMGSARFYLDVSVQVPDLAPLKDLLGNRVVIPDWQVWVMPERLEEANKLVRDWELNRSISRTALVSKLAREVEAIGIADLQKVVDRLPTSGRGRQALSEIFKDPQSQLAQRLLRNPPQELQVTFFRGKSGLLILPTGETRRTSYEGSILGIGSTTRVLSLRSLEMVDPNKLPN